MKKVFAFFMVLAMPLFIMAQVEKPITKGNFLIGGDASGSYIKSTYQDQADLESFNFGLSPSVGYFIGNGLVIGVSPFFDYTNMVARSWDWLSVGAGVYLKYYLKSGLFFSGNTNYRYNHIFDDNFSDENGHSIDLSTGIGYAFFLNSKISIEPSLNYKFTTYSTSPTHVNQFYFSIGFQKFL